MINIRNFLPYFIKKRLWGDRKKFGIKPIISDPSWQEWTKTYTTFYKENQRSGIGNKVNNLGYSILSRISLKNKIVMEIGPGDITHIKYWKGEMPKKYYIVDSSKEMMNVAEKKLENLTINYEKIEGVINESLPIKSRTIDVIISFYSLEHIYPLENYLVELKRVLKKDGIIVGAIPAEGGLAWGLGRFLTSRNWFLKNTNINPDKIICWEHPNFADFIIKKFDKLFIKKYLKFSPFGFGILDLNLVLKFIYINKN